MMDSGLFVVTAACGLILGLGIHSLSSHVVAAGEPQKRTATFRLLSAEGKPILTEADIVAYLWPTHTLILKPGIIAKMKSVLTGKQELVKGTPFKIEANGVVCYEGVFTTSISSFSQSVPVINLHPISDTHAAPERTELVIELGYPTEEYFKGKDPRGDARIHEALTSLGILRGDVRQSNPAKTP